jgi:translation initiation factor 5B
VKAGVGPVGKIDLVSAKTNIEINPLDAVILGFNVEVEEGLEAESGNVKIIKNPVVYKLIEDLQEWRKNKSAEIERERLLGLATICKLEILPQYVFRNSNPAIFGVRVLGGRLRTGLPLIDNEGEEVARVKGMQHEKSSVEEAKEGQELAISLPGVTFDRRLKDVKYLYVNVSESQYKDFRSNEDLLSSKELSILSEVEIIKRKKHANWGK